MGRVSWLARGSAWVGVVDGARVATVERVDGGWGVFLAGDDTPVAVYAGEVGYALRAAERLVAT